MRMRESKMENRGWHGRAGTPLPAAVTSLAGRRCRAAGVGVPTPYRCGYFIALFCFCLLPFAFCLRASGQSYSIDWYKIAGGGGTSSNSQYTVSGTIGQPDAGGPMTSGNYSLTGGFWALPQAVQTAGAPTLIIVPAGPGQTQISWTPDTGTNWVLQESATLSPASWINSASGATNPVVVPATLPTKFYRLFKL